jgi:hypothetical protein
MSWVLIAGLAVAFVIANVAYLSWYLHWEARETRGMA